jgi:hypothetical protein
VQLQGGAPQPREALPGAQRRRREQHFGLGKPALGWRSMPTTLPSPEQRRKKRSRRNETVAAVARLKEARTSRVASASRPSPSQGTASRGKSKRAEACKPTRNDEAADWRGDCQDWFEWTPRGCSTDCNGLGWVGPCSTTFGPNGPSFVGQAARVIYCIISTTKKRQMLSS